MPEPTQQQDLPVTSILPQVLLLAAYNGCDCNVCKLLRETGPQLISPPKPAQEETKDAGPPK